MTPRQARSRRIALLGVVLAHLVLLAWWTMPARPPAAPPSARVTLRLLPAARAPAPAATPQPPAAPRPAANRPSPRTPAASRPPATGEAAAQPPAAPEPITAARIDPPAPAASAAPAPSLLDGEATRRAIRASARDPGLAAQAGRAGPEATSPDQRLGSGIAQGARGDCLKGEYFGGGAGLLSLPFLAAAALRDQCRR